MGSWEEPWLKLSVPEGAPRVQNGHLNRMPTALGEVLRATANLPE